MESVMDRHAHQSATLPVPSSDEARLAVEQARKMFCRALPGWASDMLRAQRAGLTRIQWRANRSQRTWRQAA
jgi:hypothetical protein